VKDFRGRTDDTNESDAVHSVPAWLLPLGRLLSGERRSAGGAGVRFEPEIARHVVSGLGQQGHELPAVGGTAELLERHAQTGLDADCVRVVVVLVVHDCLRQFAFDVLVLQVFQFFG